LRVHEVVRSLLLAKSYLIVSDEFLEGLGRLFVEKRWLLESEGVAVLALIFRLGYIPSEGALEVLRGLKVVTGLLELARRGVKPSDKFLEGFGRLGEPETEWILKAGKEDKRILKNEDVLNVIIKLGEVRLLSISPDRNWMPSNAALAALRKHEVITKVLMENEHLRPSDAVLEGLGALPPGHHIFQERRVIRLQATSRGGVHIPAVFQESVVLIAILERDTMPTGSVLEGLGNLPNDHLIFVNLPALKKVMDKRTMPNDNKLRKIMRSTTSPQSIPMCT
jgi:hypothetical protein